VTGGGGLQQHSHFKYGKRHKLDERGDPEESGGGAYGEGNEEEEEALVGV
jgi:hypothetical protein